MLRLVTFGSLALVRDGAPQEGAVGQRRRLMLLALLAASGRHGVPRDRVLGLFWPDDGPAAARHSLDQSTHVIRRAVGVDAVRGTGTLMLDPAVVTSDVAEFDAAVERGAWETAARVYVGPFLDGVDAPAGLDELARWSAGARARRAGEYAAALARLADDARVRSDVAAAVQWSRRLVAAEPLDAAAVCGLVEALVAAGDGTGALRAARLHEQMVRAELDAAPDTAVLGWITRLRAGMDAAAPAVRSAQDERRDAAPAVRSGAREGDARPWNEFVRTRLQSRYEVGAVVHEGPTMTTFDARDRQSTCTVRLHVLAARRAVGEAATIGALRVLERVAALDDPRIERVLACEAGAGLLFYATAPAVGLSLRERLAAEHALSVDEAVRVGVEVAAALAAAATVSVAHGDLRPKHVRVGPAGVMLSGLGVVQAIDALRPADDASTAVTVGAPAYLSPEQIAGGVTADTRSDVYALGCVLFEMLAGAPPFGRGGALGMLTRKLHERPPSVRAQRAGVPDALDAMIAQMLAAVPADRPRSAADVRDALQEWAHA